MQPLALVPNRPTVRDLQLHALSLQVAAMYRSIHIESNGTESQALDDLLAAYRSIRRHINYENDDCRYGSHAAFLAMQGQIG
jgi:hypothetical protein